LRILSKRVSKDASVQLFSGADFEMRGFAVLSSMKAGVRLGGRQFREPWPSIFGLAARVGGPGDAVADRVSRDQRSPLQSRRVRC
jgi:hypothetical protein